MNILSKQLIKPLLCWYSCHSWHLLFIFEFFSVAFKIYDINQDGFISNGELFTVLKMMVGNNLKDVQLQQIVDKTMIQFDTDGDGRISYEEFCNVSSCFNFKLLSISSQLHNTQFLRFELDLPLICLKLFAQVNHPRIHVNSGGVFVMFFLL